MSLQRPIAKFQEQVANPIYSIETKASGVIICGDFQINLNSHSMENRMHSIEKILSVVSNHPWRL